MKSLCKFSRLFSVLGIGGSVRYLTMGGWFGGGEISRYRPVRVAVGESAWPLETVRKAALLALNHLPCQVQTVVITGKCCQIMATVEEVGVFMRLKRVSTQFTRIAVKVARSTPLGQATADTILEQTCRIAPQISKSLSLGTPFKGFDLSAVYGNLERFGRKDAA